MNIPTKPRAWVRQPSGKHLDLINPSPDDFDDSDLALGLARAFRWGGHSVWERPLSVAQHSLTVLHIRLQSDSDLSPRLQLMELFHDAEEGLVGFDPISPLKALLGPEFQAVMDRLQRAVFSKYGLSEWSEEEYILHKMADVQAAASEAVHVAGWSHAEVRDVLGIQVPPLDKDPLVGVFSEIPWKPWFSELATSRFTNSMRALLRQN